MSETTDLKANQARFIRPYVEEFSSLDGAHQSLVRTARDRLFARDTTYTCVLQNMTTLPPTTQSPTTQSPTTQVPTNATSTTQSPTTQSPTNATVTTQSPTTQSPTNATVTTQSPTTQTPTTQSPTTQTPTTQAPTTQSPTTQSPTTQTPTTPGPTTPPPTYSFDENYPPDLPNNAQHVFSFLAVGRGFDSSVSFQIAGQSISGINGNIVVLSSTNVNITWTPQSDPLGELSVVNLNVTIISSHDFTPSSQILTIYATSSSISSISVNGSTPGTNVKLYIDTVYNYTTVSGVTLIPPQFVTGTPTCYYQIVNGTSLENGPFSYDYYNLTLQYWYTTAIYSDGNYLCNLPTMAVSQQVFFFFSYFVVQGYIKTSIFVATTVSGTSITLTYWAHAPVPISAAFTSSCSQIIVNFDVPTNAAGSSLCGTYLQTSPSTAHGYLGPNCEAVFLTPQSLQLTLQGEDLSSNSAIGIIPGASLVWGANTFGTYGALYTDNISGFSQVSPPAMPTPPVLLIDAADLIPTCVGITVSIERSQGNGGRPFSQIIYSLTEDTITLLLQHQTQAEINNVVDVLNAAGSSASLSFTIAGSQLVDDFAYTFNITLGNFCGESTNGIVTVSTTNQSIPLVIVEGVAVTTRPQFTSLKADINYPGCIPVVDQKPVLINWGTPTADGAAFHLQFATAPASSSIYTVPPFSLSPLTRYMFDLVVASPSNSFTAFTIFVPLVVESVNQLDVSITGGAYVLQLANTALPLSVIVSDGDYSDAENANTVNTISNYNFNWSCAMPSGEACKKTNGELITLSPVYNPTLPALPEALYILTLVMTRIATPQITATAYQSVQIVNSYLEGISCSITSPNPASTAFGATLQCIADGTVITSNSLTVTWTSLTDINGIFYNTISLDSTNLVLPSKASSVQQNSISDSFSSLGNDYTALLKFNPNVLVPGASYAIQAVVTQEGVNSNFITVVVINIDAGPTSGICSMTTPGDSLTLLAFTDQITVSCNYWATTFSPLFYQLFASSGDSTPIPLSLYSATNNMVSSNAPGTYSIYAVITDGSQTSIKVPVGSGPVTWSDNPAGLATLNAAIENALTVTGDATVALSGLLLTASSNPDAAGVASFLTLLTESLGSVADYQNLGPLLIQLNANVAASFTNGGSRKRAVTNSSILLESFCNLIPPLASMNNLASTQNTCYSNDVFITTVQAAATYIEAILGFYPENASYAGDLTFLECYQKFLQNTCPCITRTLDISQTLGSSSNNFTLACSVLGWDTAGQTFCASNGFSGFTATYGAAVSTTGILQNQIGISCTNSVGNVFGTTNSAISNTAFINPLISSLSVFSGSNQNEVYFGSTGSTFTFTISMNDYGANLLSSTYYGNSSLPVYTPICAYFDTTSSYFDNAGCDVISVDTTVSPPTVQCQCNHLTDFAIVLQNLPVPPTLPPTVSPTSTPTNKQNPTSSNSPTSPTAAPAISTGAIIGIVFGVLLVVAAVFLIIIGFIYVRKDKKPDEATQQQIKQLGDSMAGMKEEMKKNEEARIAAEALALKREEERRKAEKEEEERLRLEGLNQSKLSTLPPYQYPPSYQEHFIQKITPQSPTSPILKNQDEHSSSSENVYSESDSSEEEESDTEEEEESETEDEDNEDVSDSEEEDEDVSDSEEDDSDDSDDDKDNSKKQ